MLGDNQKVPIVIVSKIFWYKYFCTNHKEHCYVGIAPIDLGYLSSFGHIEWVCKISGYEACFCICI